MDKKKNIYIIILAITSAFFFFYKLGELPLLDPDEPRYAEVAREMGETNDFLVPYFNYQPRLKKPPLFYWLIFLAYKIFGINEFSARFPSALFAFMGVFLTYLMGKKLYSYFTGFLAGLILATSLEYLVLSRLAITDMVLCGFFLSCLFFFLKYRETRRDIFLLLFWISLALAFLTKGPVGLLPLLIGLFFMLSERDFSFLRVFFLRKIYFSSLFFILGLSWYVAVAFKFGFAEMFSLFRYETIERFGSGYIHREPFLYFIPVILLGFFPWTVFLPWLRIKISTHRFLIVWFLVVFLFFSLSRSKIPTYVISLFPCLSIMLAQFWESNFLKKDIEYRKKIIYSIIILLVFLVLALIGSKIFLKKRYNLEIEILYLLFSFVCLSGLCLFLALRRKNLLLFASVSIIPLVSLFIFYQLFARDFSNFRSTKSLLERVKKEIKPQDTIIAYRFPKPSLVFYLGKKIVFIQDLSEFLNYLEKPRGSFWLFLKEDDFTNLKERFNLMLKNKVHKQVVCKLVIE